MNNAAFLYSSPNYSTAHNRLMGRHSATESFLLGYAMHAQVDALYCCSVRKGEYDDFTNRVSAVSDRGRATRWIPFSEPYRLTEPGCLFRPGPNIAQLAWQRRRWGQTAYSLCGVTHTTATQRVMDGIGALITAPVQPWDALVCTSGAVKATVEHVLDSWEEYLQARLGGNSPARPKLPIIPLGIDTGSFQPDDAARVKWRERLGIRESDIAVLYVGRFDLREKANPLPMYLGLEEAVRRTGRRVHLIQAGWFANASSQRAIRGGAKTFAPSVRHYFLDGRDPPIRTQIWHAADIFTSLPDNIQETFGLTPLEAMAAGLPVVASDWDGYRDTVRHGKDGLLVPTAMPPPGCGRDLAEQFDVGPLSYAAYCAATAQTVAVEPEACAQAFVSLINDKELRRRLGNAGLQRARETYDWRAVIPTYQDLLAELASLRLAGSENLPLRKGDPIQPLRDDPYALFETYPTRTLAAETTIELAPASSAEALDRFWSSELTNLQPSTRPPRKSIARLVNHLENNGAVRLEDLLAMVSRSNQAVLYRGLGWLIKTGLARLLPAEDTDE